MRMFTVSRSLVIPFKDRKRKKREEGDKPVNHVRAIDEREHYEIRFPIVERYSLTLEKTISRRT